MRKRPDPAAAEDDDQKLISLQDKHDADRLLHEAYAAGWDAALSFVQTHTDDPVPTETPDVPIGVG